MTRTAAKTISARKTGSDLEAWLLGDPELDPEARCVLTAYRAASDAARAASAKPDPETKEPVAAVADVSPATSAPQPASTGVPRLRVVEGVEGDRLADLHGKLLAAGYLTADLLARTEGLAYRVTREGLRKLAGEAEAEAA